LAAAPPEEGSEEGVEEVNEGAIQDPEIVQADDGGGGGRGGGRERGRGGGRAGGEDVPEKVCYAWEVKGACRKGGREGGKERW